MSDTKIYQETLRGVGCTVETCKYHMSGDHCCANRIYVQNTKPEDATCKSETLCATFAPKSST